MCREQHLVGGDHGDALLESTPHPASGRIDAADDLDDRVRLRREELIDILRPRHGARYPASPFTRHATIEDVRQLEAIRQLRAFCEDACDRASHGAEAEERDA